MALSSLKERWQKLRSSATYHNVVLYIIFVGIAAVFWYILALNDSAIDGFDMKVNIYNVPDSVTFINEPPNEIHIVVRDKGTTLVRQGVIHKPTLNINFKDFSRNGIFRFGKNDIMTAIKNSFGANAQVLSTSVDSLRLVYTTLKGRRIPVEVSFDLEAASGSVISPRLKIEPSSVTVYSANAALLDTMTRVFTQKVVKRNLEENINVTTSIVAIPGVRVVPTTVNVGVTVEPLVSKETMVQVRVDNVPPGESVVLFPSKVPVSYYVPLSKFGETQSGIAVDVEYADVHRIDSRKLPLRISHIPDAVSSVSLLMDSVEYTLVKNGVKNMGKNGGK